MLPNADKFPADNVKPGNVLGHQNFNESNTYEYTPFGDDFNNHLSYRQNELVLDWAALCGLDSDKDSLTNGEELGDPDCLWSYGETPKVTDKTLLSNPGLQDVTSPPAAGPSPTMGTTSAPKSHCKISYN